jgi:pyridoxamine 5'-phosphate oxidase family protein
MSFTNDEIAYLRSQPLARLATVSPDGQPDNVPVGVDFDGTYLYVGGHGDPTRTRKFLNIRDGNPKLALVFDDLASTQPWTPRFLRIYGTGELIHRDGRVGAGTYLKITPTISWSYNLGPEPRAFMGGGDPPAPPLRTVHQPLSGD